MGARSFRSGGVAYLQYTSGSTTAPKGVIASHQNVLSNCAELSAGWPTDDDAVFITWLPHYHDMGLVYGIIQPIFDGRPCYLMAPAAFLQRPETWIKSISNYKATHSGAPNFAYDLCTKTAETLDLKEVDLSRWAVAFSGAEPVRAETIQRFTKTFQAYGFRPEAFSPGYGLAEATLKVASSIRGKPPVFYRVDRRLLERHAVLEVEEADPEGTTLVGCGLPALNTRVAIVRPASREICDAGAVGEVWVAGPSVALGYWNRPEETAATFEALVAPDSAALANSGEGPFLRTGDLGFIKDGDLFITGRLKDLIIIRGRNHYPQDIELTVEKSHSHLRPGRGAAFAVEEAGQERLAIVQEVSRHHESAAEGIVKEIRRAVLEEHELDPFLIVLIRSGTIAKTTSGKIQRRACRDSLLEGTLDVVVSWRSPVNAGETLDPSPSMPGLGANRLSGHSLGQSLSRTAVEEYVLSLIGPRIGLGPGAIAPDQSLTSLGLDSIAAAGLLHELESSLGVRFGLSEILSDVSIDELTAEVYERLANQARIRSRFPGKARDTGGQPLAEATAAGTRSWPASRGQQALWYLYKLSPQSTAYNITIAARLAVPVEMEVLRGACQLTLDHHSILRARFQLDDRDQLIQTVDESAELDFTALDASGWDEAELRDRLNHEAARTFDLERGPLFRIRLFLNRAAGDVVLIAVHHIVADFWSMAIVLSEIGSWVTSQSRAKTTPEGGMPCDSTESSESAFMSQVQSPPWFVENGVPPANSQYADFVRWQEEMLSGPEGEQHWEFWKSQFPSEPPALELPLDYPRPLEQTYRGSAYFFSVDEQTTGGLRALSRDHRVTLFTVLLAAFEVLLHRYSGQEQFAIGTPAAGRTFAETAPIVGYFVNPVAIRSTVNVEAAFDGVLIQTRGAVLAAL
ncbi:MAG TPA: condensation domain-containing protein, partial [Blastocatellia bacterium]|nr:condensation domain-containing protein [Blastocatellia bacterium]